MSTTRLNPARPLAPASMMDNWARRAVHALLRKLTQGCLVVEENGEVLSFGADRHDARLTACIQIRNPAAYPAVLRGGSVGAGEAYMRGWWDSPDLVQVIRLFVTNMHAVDALDDNMRWWQRLGLQAFHWLRANSRPGARRNIAAHYDLGNELFALFLDDTMAYSAARFSDASITLEEASRAKFHHICTRLELCAGDHLLEIGTGWGGLAIHAARHFNCRVTTTTLSHEQYRYAQDWVQREGLADRVTVLQRDYRELDGQFDKLVSVEMIEAVGAGFYADYFSRCAALLKPAGLMLIQAITIPDQRYVASLRTTDFIKRYIFPGGQLPCTSVIARHVAEDTDMHLLSIEDMTRDYALTLQAWHERFQGQLPAVRQLGYDETFIRMWRYYLCFCEGAFRERAIHTAQFLLAKPGYRALD